MTKYSLASSLWTLDDLNSLIDESERESATLEFKAGQALTKDSKSLIELVKDATGLANAGGGTIVYGITEAEIEGIKRASSLSPVVDTKITPDWVTQVLRSNTQPPLRLFDVHEIVLPSDDRVGRAIVLTVEAGHTAHQSMLDRKYYQRGAATTEAMFDFQIRDVMGRRTAAIIEVRMLQQRKKMTADEHHYSFVPRLFNAGLSSVEKWQLELSIPSDVHDAPTAPHIGYDRVLRSVDLVDGVHYDKITYPSGLAVGHALEGIYPGQELILNRELGLPDVRVIVRYDSYQKLRCVKPAIRWRLFVPNASALEEELPFAEWCVF